MSDSIHDKVSVHFRQGEDLARHRVALEYSIRLMMMVNATRAGIRWVKSICDANSPNPIDMFTAFLALSAWCAESIVVLRDGRRRGLISKDMLRDDQELQAVWDEVLSDAPSEDVQMMFVIRDKCSAHWDPVVARAGLDLICEDPEDYPFVETIEGGKVGNTWYPWAGVAVAAYLGKGDPSPEVFREVSQRASDLGFRLMRVSSELLDRILFGIGCQSESVGDEG